MESRRVKTADDAPIPRPRVAMATVAKRGRFSNARRVIRKSCRMSIRKSSMIWEAKRRRT